MKNVTTSLVLCTYNWENALRLVLISASKQTIIPTEIVIADDGSRETTRDVIEEIRHVLPCPIKHVWHEDKGYCRAMIMNRAFAVCTSDYIIQIDGDIIMERHFIEDHLRHACHGFYLSGSRGKLTRTFTDTLCQGDFRRIYWWTKGVTRRLNTLRLPWLTPLLYKYKQNGMDRGCNLSFWRADLYAVNGYDNGMVGYGSEDIDLTARICRLGVRKRFVKFSCVEYHLYHREVPSKSDSEMRRHNQSLRSSNNSQGIIRVKSGLSDFLPPKQP